MGKYYAKKVRNFAKEEEKKLNKLSEKEYKESKDRSHGTSIFMKDYSRVLYSSSFRRLQGKMQLLGVDPSNFNRNRLTHSLEVAQIARSISTNLGLKDIVVSETASLAHDLGNPPFGHYGEMILNRLSEDFGGFEGNAQTFRILHRLEKKHYKFSGLNLTLRTLLGVTKYFNNREMNSKKFLYDEDYEFLKNKLDGLGLEIDKSIDAQIMDISDEIAYAAHDLEDALSSGLLNLGEMVHEFKICSKYNEAYADFAEIAKKVQEKSLKAKKLKTSEEYTSLLIKEITSRIVHELCKDVGIVDNKLGYKTKAKLAEGLKKLLFNALLRKKDIQHYEKKGEKIIRGLYDVYSDKSYNKKNILLPAELRNLPYPKERLVVDYISGMMDFYAEKEYKKYFGQNSLDKLYK